MMIGNEEVEELVPQLRFPAGYHFLPTDEELLDVYLRAKIDGREPPLDVFMDVDILDWHPALLLGTSVIMLLVHLNFLIIGLFAELISTSVKC